MRVGTVCYSTEQGLGYLAKSFYDAGVITEVMLIHYPRRKNHLEWYPPETTQLTSRPFTDEQVDRWLDKVDIVLFFETPFDWSFVAKCRERGVKTALMPMYEWHLINPPYPMDGYINPSLLDQQYFPHGTFIPVPVDPTTWQLRSLARKFLHNAGHIGCRGHKGTLEILQAMQYVRSPISLTVRSQNEAGLEQLVDRVPIIREDARVQLDYADYPYEKLFDDHDVFIMAEKFNGLSLPLQEARAAGMVVVTSNRFPMNVWLPEWCLIPVHHYSYGVQTQGGNLKFDEAIVEPKAIAETIDMLYNRDIQQYSLGGLDWAKRTSWEVLKPRYLEALEAI